MSLFRPKDPPAPGLGSARTGTLKAPERQSGRQACLPRRGLFYDFAGRLCFHTACTYSGCSAHLDGFSEAGHRNSRIRGWIRASRRPLPSSFAGAAMQPTTGPPHAAALIERILATRSEKRSPCTTTWLRRASAARASSPAAIASTISACSASDWPRRWRVPKLQAAIGGQPPAQQAGLLGEEGVAAGGVDHGVEHLVLGVVALGVAGPPADASAASAAFSAVSWSGVRRRAAKRPQAASSSAMVSNIASRCCGSGALTIVPLRGLVSTSPVTPAASSLHELGCVTRRSARRA